MVAVMHQAVRDMGLEDIESVLWWTKTRGFREICFYLDLIHEDVASVLADLARYDRPVRRAMLKEMTGW